MKGRLLSIEDLKKMHGEQVYIQCSNLELGGLAIVDAEGECLRRNNENKCLWSFGTIRRGSGWTGVTVRVYEWIREPKEFTKKDLKTGMWVECKNGKRYLAMLNVDCVYDNNILVNNNGWLDLKSHNDNLTHKYEGEYSIIKVYKNNFAVSMYKGEDLKLIWERKEEKPKNHIEQIVNITFTYNGETIILTQHENETEVKLTDGTIAKTFCNENSEFDRDKGLDIAYWKAKRIQADSMLSKVKGYIDDVCDMNKTLTGSKIQDKIQEDVDDDWL
jgi:hypothetical protein